MISRDFFLLIMVEGSLLYIYFFKQDLISFLVECTGSGTLHSGK